MRRTPRRSAFVSMVCVSMLAAALAFAGTTATASATNRASSSLARAAGTLKVSPARVASGKPVSVRGSVRSGPRRVVVQTRVAGTKWRTVARGKSARSGAFRFTIKLRSPLSRRYAVRVVAPRARVRGKVVRTVTTRTVAVAVSVTPENEVLYRVNRERAKAGCRAVVAESHLRVAARAHSSDMIARNYFSHTSPDGKDMADRVQAAGYTGYSRLGENIAAGQTTAEQVMSEWMKSSGHRANILNCHFTELGVGVARGGTYGIYWTQNFGRR